MLESIQRSNLYDFPNLRYERSYTNVFDLHFRGHQGQVTNFKFSKILDIVSLNFFLI